MDSLKLLAHSSKPDGCPCVFPWNTVIKRIFCFSSDLRINSRDIAYVDLPGYSATADDDDAMMEASQGCDRIVYFKPVQSGGLIEKDLEYLKSINRNDVMIVLSKAERNR